MAATGFNLFEEAPQPQNSKWSGAPKLRPKGGGPSIVNIRDNYRWTISPKDARSEIPTIEFQELELDLSSLITTALYKIRGGIENVAGLNQQINETLSKVTSSGATPPATALGGTATTDTLNPYAGMYAATPTGFTYVAPYLEQLNQGVNNRWGDDQSNSLASRMGDVVKNLGDAASNVLSTTNLANITAPGSYAEKPRFFNPGETDSYTINFPLLNTFDPLDIQKNWELCYLLTYQNLANRRSINLLDPPVLYRVTIPGIRQSPVAYISKLSIMHMGNLRMVDINGRSKPVPEAYMVSLTFQDLLINSRNIFKYALDEQQVVATIAPSKIAQPLGASVGGAQPTP